MEMTKIIVPLGGHLVILCHQSFDVYIAHKWMAAKRGKPYISRAYNKKKKGGRLGIHRQITNCPDGLVVDHINGNVLDNRISNLRICTYSQNSRNKGKIIANPTSKYLGVCRCPWYIEGSKRKKWIAFSQENKKTKTIGSYNCEIEAAIARDRYVKERYGEFARLNFTCDPR